MLISQITRDEAYTPEYTGEITIDVADKQVGLLEQSERKKGKGDRQLVMSIDRIARVLVVDYNRSDPSYRPVFASFGRVLCTSSA